MSDRLITQYRHIKLLLYINVSNSVSVRVDLRMLRLFPINRRATVYTVEQILEGRTEELQALQQFILRDQGRQ